MPRKTPKRHAPGPLGSVRQLPSGRFQAYYRHDGRTFTAPATFLTRDAARGWLANERADRALGTWRDPRLGQLTFGEYAQGWLESRTNLTARTRQLYAYLLSRRILPPVNYEQGGRLALGTLALSAITPALVRTWFARMSADCARDAARPRRRAWVPGSTHGPHPARAWATAAGISVATQGRLSAATLAAWDAAGRPSPADPDAEPVPSSRTGQTTAAQAYRLLHAMLSTAVTDGLIATNPARVKGAGVVAHAERQTATPDEVSLLAAGMPEHLAAAVWLAAWSGLRRGELLALTRRTVDLTAGTVRVEYSLGRDGLLHRPKTRASVRTVHLPAFVREQLADHMRRYTGSTPDSLVFTNTTGTPVHTSYLLKAFGRARAAIGRPGLSWHDLRHTGATFAYLAGGSVRDVQRRLGHATVRAAMIYAHAADDSDRTLAERLDAAFGPTHTPPPQSPPPTTVNRHLTPTDADGTSVRLRKLNVVKPERNAS